MGTMSEHWACLTDAMKLATLRAQAALAGAELVAFGGDDGGAELLLTLSAVMQRFHDLSMAGALNRQGEGRN